MLKGYPLFFMNVVLLILVAISSLPLLVLYVYVFLIIGGGWAYAGPGGCHFVINPIGVTMLAVPALLLCRLAWVLVSRNRPAKQIPTHVGFDQ